VVKAFAMNYEPIPVYNSPGGCLSPAFFPVSEEHHQKASEKAGFKIILGVCEVLKTFG